MKLIALLFSAIMSIVMVTANTTTAYAQSTPVEESSSDDPQWERWDAGPIVVQSVAGAAGGLAVGLLSAFVAFEAGDGDAAILMTAAGTVTGSAIGVWLAGSLFDGDGSFLWTLGASVLGAVVTVSTVLLLDEASGGNDDASAAFTAIGGPVLVVGGGIIGYHLSSSEVIPGVSVAPTDGGAAAVLSWTF